MNLLRALRYFFVEAWVGLARSWRVSALAILTIGVSLFLAGTFLLTSQNLSLSIAAWKEEARFAVYLADEITEPQRLRIESALRDSTWVAELAFVSPAEGAARFRSAFPSLAELVDDRRYGELPGSFEARVRALPAADRGPFRQWSEAIAALDGVETVDDDREWIDDVEALLNVVRAVGTILTAVLLGAAVLTIAAVVRLTSFLYRDEISIMRLVGATEFVIRGPFYVEGLLQGVLGAATALCALRLAHFGLHSKLTDSLVLQIAAREFLSGREVLALLAFGALAGLGGALVSLSREQPTSEQT